MKRKEAAGCRLPAASPETANSQQLAMSRLPRTPSRGRGQGREASSLIILVLLVRLLAEYAARRWGFLTPAQVAEKFSAESVAEWLDDFRQWMRDYPLTEKFTNEIVTTLQSLQKELT